MKFGKQIQKRQLEIPEYASSFVDYKALKKLIKALSATPVLLAQNDPRAILPPDPKEALQANKATFFFRLERELEKVNKFYLKKEAELKLRLGSLLDQKRSMQAQQTPASRSSSRYIALEEGFHQFSRDLSKLQQFIEINATAFSKILKKWDKTSKSDTKVVFLSRAVEVQPCFNRDVISNLSDQATNNLLDFAAWAEGEKIQFTNTEEENDAPSRSVPQEDSEIDYQIIQAITAGNLKFAQEWADRTKSLPDAAIRLSRVFFATADEAPEDSLKLLLKTGFVNLSETDQINHRNILHKAAITGKLILLQIGLEANVDVTALDIYGRIPLHYACMHGSVDMIQSLVAAKNETIEFRDYDRFTPLIHSIVHEKPDCVRVLLSYNVQINRASEQDHIPLNLACQHGSSTVVRLLLEHKPQILPDAEGLYPQHLIARSSKAPQLLKLLQQYGADLDQQDKLYQWTSLFHAASEGNVECLRALLDCHVNTKILDEKGLSALYYATWEGHLDCIQLLIGANISSPAVNPDTSPPVAPMLGLPASSTTPKPLGKIEDTIPDLTLPPAIIPIRRYGHNFLESKTFVILNFGTFGSDAIIFYDDNKYPAARVTITSKSSDLIPRNLLLPIQDDSKVISFQIDKLESFSIEFDVYATFGARVIARAVASSKVFTSQNSSSGVWYLELLDPRLRAVGRLSFSFLVVKPYIGIPLEVTHFATYWKATTQHLEHQQPSASPFITGSSLSGHYVRLFIQVTCDGVPIIYPQWTVEHAGLDIPVLRTTWAQFQSIGAQKSERSAAYKTLEKLTSAASFNQDRDLPLIHQSMANCFETLARALDMLPATVNVELHILYPSGEEEQQKRLGPTPTINEYADALLSVVFEHARRCRERDTGGNGWIRSVVFSSYNPEICIALNWKQPNYPVLFCNDLGAKESIENQVVKSSGRTILSVKEAVSTARNNNFMGLICRQRLLTLAPTLIDTIKSAGLVVVSDMSGERNVWNNRLVAGKVDGAIRSDGLLVFTDNIDISGF